MMLLQSDRAAVVKIARQTIARGSQSFAASSRLFAPEMRERAWLLYSWCRAADDMIDGQDLGRERRSPHDVASAHASLQHLTDVALAGEDAVPPPFAALRIVAREVQLPVSLIHDHLAGFALDASGWRPNSEDDLLRYCYHVAGSVGCMMAIVMGVDPADDDTLDRACDLGVSFQLANIARDLLPDAQVGRSYVPQDWFRTLGCSPQTALDHVHRAVAANIAKRLVALAAPYRVSGRFGAKRLPIRARIAVLSADAIYGAIGEEVLRLGDRAWDGRVRIGSLAKTGHIFGATLRAMAGSPPRSRTGLWTRSRHSEAGAGSRSWASEDRRNLSFSRLTEGA